MKTKEELNALKEEIESLNKKLADLTEEELTQVAGGWTYWLPRNNNGTWPYNKKEDTDGNSWGPHWGE